MEGRLCNAKDSSASNKKSTLPNAGAFQDNDNSVSNKPTLQNYGSNFGVIQQGIHQFARGFRENFKSTSKS